MCLIIDSTISSFRASAPNEEHLLIKVRYIFDLRARKKWRYQGTWLDSYSEFFPSVLSLPNLILNLIISIL